MEVDNKLKVEAKNYFGRRAFLRLFSSFKIKLESFGKPTGTVSFAPTKEERTAIENWFGYEFLDDTINVSLIKFEKRLIGSKFEEFNLWGLVELVTGSPIVLKVDKMEEEERRRIAFYQGLAGKYNHQDAQSLIEMIVNKEKGTTGFVSSYNSGDIESIEVIVKAISNLPRNGEFERIPIFAERITGNPHYFDDSSKLYQALELLLSKVEDRSYRSYLNAEDEDDLLSLFGLAKDDLHSFVTCYGLEAYRDGKMLNQWHWANEERSVQNIPLRSMKRIDEVKPVRGNAVFILENSGVYSSIVDKLENGIYPVICTHGNFKLSGLLLMDKLIKSETQLYYSGDIDVNGIKMAQFLKSKYGDSVQLWRMGLNDYEKSLSQVPLKQTTLSKLNYVTEPELIRVIDEMKIQKKAGYQEPLLDLLVDDIVCN